MTRFMMTLEDAVELVLYAFQHGTNGDIFVQKAPAATVAVLAQALLELMNRPDHEIREIGTRHGEKLYEALLSREEMASCRRPRRVLSRSAGRPRPELRQVRRTGRASHQPCRRLQLAQHASAGRRGDEGSSCSSSNSCAAFHSGDRAMPED